MLNYLKFSKKLRIVSKKDFADIKNHSSKKRDRFFVVNVKVNHLTYSRLGVIVSKKSIPKAVCRNKLRRYCKEWFRLSHQNFPGYDVVIVIRHNALTLSAKKTTVCLNKLLQPLLKHCKLSSLEV